MKYRSKRTGIYRSGTEEVVAAGLAEWGIVATYESAKLGYIQHKRYTPDFTVGDCHIEVKGWWPPADRAKFLSVIHSNPGVRILVALEYPDLTLSKKSKTTYSQWCDKHGIFWCGIPIPCETLSLWLKKPIFPAQGQTATVQTAQQRIQMDPFTALSAKADTAPMVPLGKGQ